MTEYLSPNDVDNLIDSLGFIVRDRNLLSSSLSAPLPVFDEEVYLGPFNKAAALMISINSNHPLADGNKRLSWILTKAFLALNGHHLAADSVHDGDNFVRSVAAHDVEFVDVTAWIESRATRL